MAKYYKDFTKDDIGRGEIYYIYPAKTMISDNTGRPGVIVSNDRANEHSSCVEVVYLTSQNKNPLPTHVEVRCKENIATALCESIQTVPKDRIGDFVKVCTEEEMRNIDIALCESLGIELETDVDDSLEGELIEISKERDIYKTLYNDLLNRFIP